MLVLMAAVTKPGVAQPQTVDNSFGSLPPFTRWYQNPLGVSPIALHTGNGLYIPLVAAAGILLFAKAKDSLNNRLTMYADVGYTKGYYGSYSNIVHQNTGIQYLLRPYLSVGAELSQVYVHDTKNNTYGIGIRPFFRFYPLHKQNLKLYFQSGAGLHYFFNRYPQSSGFFGDYREGTRVNGSPKYGIGTEVKLHPKWNLNAGLWHIHFSNGNNPSASRNPGHDSNGFSLGISFNPNKK